MIEKKAKQRTILNFILQKDEEIAKTYENRMATLQSMLSQFCARLKKNKSKKSRKTKDENNLESNSSKEEPENKTSNDTKMSIFQKIAQQNKEKKSFLPPDYIDGREELNKILKK